VRLIEDEIAKPKVYRLAACNYSIFDYLWRRGQQLAGISSDVAKST
jgi:hypothetical protein